LIEHPKDLSDRIHFLGPQSDVDFLAGMAICDAVVFPYLEVGQSSQARSPRLSSSAAES